MERYIVDRIEGEMAVLEREDRSFEDVPLSELPAGVQRHDCLTHDDGTWSIDRARTAERKQQSEDLFHSLFRPA